MTISWEIGELENGLRVVTTPMPTAQSVSVNVFVGAGSRGEDRRTNGLCHYIEHMMFKGTEKRPSTIAIAESIEGAGGVLNAFTTKEFTCYWNHVPYDRLDLAMEVLADMLQHSLLEPKEIERERSVVQQEIRRSYDQPATWASELLSRACFGDQPIGWPVIGTEESVAGLSRDQFVEHLRNWYVPSNIVLSVAGNTTHANVMHAAREIFVGMPQATSPAFQPARGDLPDERIIVEQRDIAQCNLGIALHAIARKDPDRYILLVLNSTLGRGMSSRLFKEVRERRGLAYSVGSAVTRYHDTGAVSVSAGVSPEKLTEATTVIRDELLKLVEELVGPEELTKARDYTVGSFRLSLETSMALGQRAGESLLTMGEIEPVEEVVEKLEAVSAEEIQRVASRIFRRDNLALAVVGPTGNADELAAMLSA